jgi:hypothetical protein
VFWKFWQKTGALPVSPRLRSLLVDKRGVTEEGSTTLRMIEQRGQYAGRSVTFFRVFNPETAARANVVPRHYRDLSDDLVLHAGHIEGDGSIVLNQPRTPGT